MTNVEQVRKRLQDSPASSRVIAKATGLKPRWVQYFRAGHITDPSATRLERLERWLAGNGHG